MAKAIERRIWGLKRQVTYTKKGAVVETIPEKDAQENAEKAAYALVDSRHFAVTAGNQAAADFYAKVTGEPVAVGASVSLDGHWSDELKAHPLSSNPRFAMAIVRFAAQMEIAAEEEEEGKDEI